MMFAQVFPWGGRLDFERGYLANGPYGDIFDVITNHAAPSTLNQYGVVWPVGDVTLSSAQQQEWMDYVKQGGILVVDSALATQLPGAFLGLRIEKTFGYATQIQSAVGAVPPLNAPFRYRPISPFRRMDLLVGKGIVIVSGTDHWLDERERLLPMADILLRALSDAFLPVTLVGDAEMIVNKTSDGWVIGLINNNGVTKTPTRPMVVNAAGARDCLLKFKDKVVLSFIPRRGEMTWNLQASAINAHLSPGDVAIVQVKVANKD
jgi:hypothetical protein